MLLQVGDIEIAERAIAIAGGFIVVVSIIWKLIDVFISQRSAIKDFKTACSGFVKLEAFNDLQNKHYQLQIKTNETSAVDEEKIRLLNAAMARSVEDRINLHNTLDKRILELLHPLIKSQEKMDGLMDEMFEKISTITGDIRVIREQQKK